MKICSVASLVVLGALVMSSSAAAKGTAKSKDAAASPLNEEMMTLDGIKLRKLSGLRIFFPLVCRFVMVNIF